MAVNGLNGMSERTLLAATVAGVVAVVGGFILGTRAARKTDKVFSGVPKNRRLSKDGY